MSKTYRRKTGLIILTMSLFMFSPIFMHLIGYRIPIFENLGLSIRTFAPMIAWIISFVVTISYVAYTFKVIPFVYQMQRELSLFKIIGLLTIVGGILEEIVFRRWLMDWLMGLGYGIILQILFSGVVFGLAHVMWGLFGRDKQFSKGVFIATTILGFGLAIVYLVGNRNIGPCIIAHSLINIIIEPWLMLAAISKTWKLKNK
ncbi:MAG: CPBP family intramembrane glutamic endopeptidase [Bacteroidales bacterium]